jgi:electron transport complex protein RnfC
LQACRKFYGELDGGINMKEYPLLVKSEIRKNKKIRTIQKDSIKRYKNTKGRYPKAIIGKVVGLREKDNFFDFTQKYDTKTELEYLSREEILKEIKEQGICGFSGSGYPTDKKIEAVIEAETKEKYLVINAVECDPGLIHDGWLIKNHLDEIEKGIHILAKFGFARIILATKEDIIPKSRDYEVYTVPNRFPMGEEKILVQEILGISISQNEVPANKGILVLNLQTVYVIYEAIYGKRKVTSKFITVADMTTGEAVVARVNLNSNVMEILNKIMGNGANKLAFFGGGIMIGRKAMGDDISTMSTNFIAYVNEVNYFKDVKCKKCGACARKCPMEVKVDKIIQALEKRDIEKVKELKPERCIHCGVCTYHCRARKDTMGLISQYE